MQAGHHWNMFGLWPVDYALTAEMQEVLRMAPEAPHPVTTTLSPPASLSKAAGCVREMGPVVVIGSQLTQTQQKQLAKAAQLLGREQVKSFSSAVTHVVVPDVPIMLSTLTTLQGILNGCWILRFSWVSCSLQAGSWVSESNYEAGDGPLRARVNKGSLAGLAFITDCFYGLWLVSKVTHFPEDRGFKEREHTCDFMRGLCIVRQYRAVVISLGHGVRLKCFAVK
uniref:BRCT domain-containing protein n=2 Tax=Cyprinus carpio TaxID=7962 RepID=A0A8C1ZIK7_CYPCA